MSCDYIAAKTIEEAISALQSNDGAKLIAGGTDILIRMRSGKEKPSVLVDIAPTGLNYITQSEGFIHIGAMARMTDVNENSLFGEEPYDLLRRAAGRVGSWQTRNLATLAGNICTGISSADTAVALLVLDASIRIAGKNGERTIPASEFFLAHRKIAINRDEMVVEALIPLYKGRWGSYFEKIGKRKELFISVLNIAVAACTHSDGRIQTIRVAMGTVAPIPKRLCKTEAYLADKYPSEEVFRNACEIMQNEISPRSSVHCSREYRVAVGSTLLMRALHASIFKKED